MRSLFSYDEAAAVSDDGDDLPLVYAVEEPPALPELRSVDTIALDTECTGLNPWRDRPVGISIAWRTDVLNTAYLPFGHTAGNLDLERVRQWAYRELPGKQVVGANLKFDLHMLTRAGIHLEAMGCRAADVAFNCALLDDERRGGLDLETMGREYAGEGKLRLPINGNTRMQDLPAHLVSQYARQDARLTFLVNEATLPLIRKDSLERVLDLENSLVYAVCALERTGCRIDVEKLGRWRREARQEYEGILLNIQHATGLLINPMTAEDFYKLARQVGVTVKEQRTAQGALSYDEQMFGATRHSLILYAIKARHITLLLSKFLDKFALALDGDILRSQYHQLKSTEEYGTVSGRFSSSGGGDPASGYSFNAQQTIKPELQRETLGDRWIVRELFIPAEGAEYFSVDAKQIEYRLFAHFSGAEKIIRRYREEDDVDFHQIVTDLVLPYAGDRLKTLPPKAQRKFMKNANFARLYQAGLKKMASMIGASEDETRKFLAAYDRIFPESRVFTEQVTKQAERDGYVCTLLGRRARFGKNHRGTHSAVNRVIQGTAADLNKMKLLRVYNERRTLGITALRMTVHDELDGDKLPGEEYTRRIRECFAVQELPLSVPITWALSCGKDWYHCG